MDQTSENIEGVVYLDADGFIDTEYYIDASIKIMNEAAEERGQNPRRINTNDAFALYRRVYNALFKPYKRRTGAERAIYEPGCRIEYNPENMRRLLEVYRVLCSEYDSLPSADGAAWLTGIAIETFDKYVTGARMFIQNIRKDNIQNKLQSFPIGVVTLANNDLDTGLCYTRQNIADRATVNKALSFNDLVKIGEKTGTIRQIAQNEEDTDTEQNAL